MTTRTFLTDPSTDAASARCARTRATPAGWRIGALRHRFQFAFFLLTLAGGVQFAFYVYQLAAGGPVVVPRPPSVEGFLPIGALMGWKLFLVTGQWDPIHPAAMVIFGFALLSAFLLRKAFCSFICPVGSLSE